MAPVCGVDRVPAATHCRRISRAAERIDRHAQTHVTRAICAAAAVAGYLRRVCAGLEGATRGRWRLPQTLVGQLCLGVKKPAELPGRAGWLFIKPASGVGAGLMALLPGLFVSVSRDGIALACLASMRLGLCSSPFRTRPA